MMTVSKKVQELLSGDGYKVVLLKQSAGESIDYRARIKKAEDAGAVLAVSIHSNPGDNALFPQRVGLYREGAGPDGQNKRVTFQAADVAQKSQEYTTKFATERGKVEGHAVEVRDNSFDGRAPLWSGNIPIISLLSTKIPWVYNEFGPASGGGGSNPIAAGDLETYAKGITAGVKASIPKCE